jgi:hypothetical protein
VFSTGSRVSTDFEGLGKRMRGRLYPESMRVLGLYWLKTVREHGYGREEWNVLDRLLSSELQAHDASSPTGQALANLRTLVEGARRLNRPGTYSLSEQPAISSGVLAPYIVRLLNEWLPVEVSRLLIEESEEDSDEPEAGIPAIAKARAIERLFLRERISGPTLEALLEPGLMSPRFIDPFDYEILRDVVLYLLGRTDAPAPPVLPAELLLIAPGASLSPDFERAVENASLAMGSETDELHVPIVPAQAIAALAGDQVHITSFLVTMDGRLWEAGLLKGGDQNVIVYHASGRIQIDYSGDHARFRLPWPESWSRGSGPIRLGPDLRMFGREWHRARFEQDGDHTIVEMVFARGMALKELGLVTETPLRHSWPASVDVAWTALENALSSENASDAIENLRHADMVPLGRAIEALIESVRDPRQRKPETIKARVKAIGFFSSELLSSYGPVRWRVLPEPIRNILLGPRLYAALAESLNAVFTGLPEMSAAPLLSANWLRRFAMRRARAA